MKKCKLGDIADIITGPFGSQLHASDYVKRGIPSIMPKDIGERRVIEDTIAHISETDAQRLSRYLVQLGDIVYSRRGDIERCALIRKENVGSLCGTGCLRVRPNAKEIDSEYLSYYLSTPKIRKWIVDNATGATMPNLNSDILRLVPLEIPNLEQQKRIAGILSSFDDKIDINNRLNATLEAMAKTLYDYWFVQFDFPDEHGRPYKTSGGSMTYSEKLGYEIPTGWNVGKMSCFIQSMTNGLNPRDNFVLNTGGNIKYLTVKNLLLHGDIDFNNCDFIDEDARSQVHKRSDIKIGDILFASIAPLGRCHLIEKEPSDWDINESVFSIRPNFMVISSEFLYMFLTSAIFIKLAESSSAGSIFKGIRVNTMMDMDILIPNKSLIDQYTEKVKKILERMEINRTENRRLTQLRDFLLPLLMNGQVTFK